ncbi:hypothetical protein HBH98_107270 [Parastagonospora nodorum]|nr:hypothetical protein HBH53_074280 [Parastagonospora nodorum]KAH4024264.1 hypothetical protein HBI13_085040 [Parastagonospora nodorum]KAH4033987.1 hypothetical protein HBI09_115320 [Parastagonospora nodorum]KAH4046539.1 hypothetical protein HBH49_184670 [Parastagonospora nodorum]KAH4061990.1 hypothetical protein HBH50_212890 [Parastagonospora nodorum]
MFFWTQPERRSEMKPQPSAPSAAAPLVVKNYDTVQAEALGPLSLAVLLARLSFCESSALILRVYQNVTVTESW